MPADMESFVDPADRTQYDLLRSKHVMIPLSIQSKLHWCGLLAFLAALVAPIVATLPPSVQQSYFVGDPLTTRLGAAAAVLVGVGGLAVATIGLTVVSLYVGRHPDPPEQRAWSLVAAEDAASGFGFVTGTLGVISGSVLLASGHWGTTAVQGLLDYGIKPYLAYEAFPATPRLAAVAGLLVSIAALASSVFAGSS